MPKDKQTRVSFRQVASKTKSKNNPIVHQQQGNNTSTSNDTFVNVTFHDLLQATAKPINWKLTARLIYKAMVTTQRNKSDIVIMNWMDSKGHEFRAYQWKNGQWTPHSLELKENHIYTIAKAYIEPKAGAFSRIQNEKEMKIHMGTTFTEETEDVNFPNLQFNFLSYDDIKILEYGQSFDFIGVVISIQRDEDSTEDQPAHIVIINDQGNELVIELRSLERRHLHTTTIKPMESILAIKGVKLVNRLPITAACFQDTILDANPKGKEAQELKDWIAEESDTATENK